MDTPAASLTTRLPAEQLVRRAVETVLFQQRVDAQGWQHESYGHVNLELLPLRRALGASDQPLTVELPIDGQNLRVGAWRAQVGRATLLLLDSDLEGNPPGLRPLTAQLRAIRPLATELPPGPPDVTDVARRRR